MPVSFINAKLHNWLTGKLANQSTFLLSNMNQNLARETVILVHSYELDFAEIINNAVYTQSAAVTTGGSPRWPKR
jgi:hypothetical protein